MKYIFVTGGNDGIGLALCKQLAVDHGCYVFMGSRSLERGAAGLKSITDANPEVASSIEVVQIDVTVIGVDPDLDVVVDHTFHSYEYFHRFTSTASHPICSGMTCCCSN